MGISASGYEERAEQCGRLAADTDDVLLKAELLKLREAYRNLADCLREISLRDREGGRIGRSS